MEDFTREQEYNNAKFRFLNAWAFGYGIVEGLHVQKIDGDSVLLDPGWCVDGEGRAVVVDSPAICKLGTLEGFGRSEGDFALLRICFQWQPSGKEYSPMGGRGTEWSTEREGYRLCLDLPGMEQPEEPLLSEWVLFQDTELRISQRIPRLLWGDGATRVQLRFENAASAELTVRLSYQLDAPGFDCVETGQELFLRDEIIRLPPGRSERTLSLRRKADTFTRSVIFSCQRERFSLEKQGERFSAPEDFREELRVEHGAMRECILGRLRKLPLEEAWNGGSMTGVTVAVLRFLRMGQKLLLDEVLPPLEEWYACHPALQHRAERLLSFYEGIPAAVERQAAPPAPSVDREEPAQQMKAIALGEIRLEKLRTFQTGIIRLEPGLNYKPGTVLYSEETIHGLGPGTVFVEFGLEEVFLDKDHSRNKSEVVLGNETLFEQLRGKDLFSLDKAVKLYPEKGSFQLAVRSAQRLKAPSLRLRWYAYRVPEEREGMRAAPGGRLKGLSPDVVSLEPKASVSFVPVFEGGGAEPCDYSLGAGEKGSISENGIYTAPDDEGIYVVSACIHRAPAERVSAFVLVKRKEGEL